MSSLFIRVHVDDEKLESDAQRRHLVSVCPVDIFALTDGRITVRTENEDECTLCELCWRDTPPGAVRVERLYASGSAAGTRSDKDVIP